jgi:hypothetical protein
VHDTLCGCLAKCAYCLREFIPSSSRICLFYGDQDFLYCCAERRTQRRIALVPPSILTGPLDG